MAAQPELLPDPAATDDSSENARNGAKKRRDPNHPAAVVGIGASAGGIAPLQQFFGDMSPESGMAFVVVMHLSPDFESQLSSVLQHKTSMPVVQVTEAVKVRPNHVYVIPPNHQLTFEDSMLRLLPPQQALGRRVTIDLFFRTLAHAYGQRAVSIIMSGTDSDGVIGLKHIRAQGGVTIAQEPEEAAFDSMPLSAINTGMVDWVLRVGDMPRRLLEFVRNENAMQLPPEIGGDVAPDAKVEEAPGGETVSDETRDPDDEEALLLVLKHVRAHTGHDFGHYKRATVLRRIARRMQVNSVDSIPRYLDFLRQHATEARALLHDLLIGVTHFFRDQTSFAALEANVPQLFAGKKRTDELRVWVTGCATGEEAYSITMLLCGHAGKLSDPPSIQVFATDVDEQAINEAREGLYPATIEADVSQERLRQFFMRDNGRYRVKKEIRDKILFAQHNVLSDPAFSRVDLVTCRNLLIYLNREAQGRVFDVFHFALRSGGLLFIGGAESADSSHSLFSPLDNHHRIYVRRSLPRPAWKIPALPARVAAPDHRRGDTARPMLPGMTSAAVEDAGEHSRTTTYEGQGRRSVMFGELHLKLLEEYGPPSVVVNEAYDIVHLSESAGRYLAFRAGEPSTNLMTVVNPALRVELRTALFRAGQSKESVIVPAQRVPVGGDTETMDLHVRPIRSGNSAQGFFLILFEKKIAALTEAEQVVERETISREVGDELQSLKGQLNATVEQFEASSEELKASNEELQAMNEELRSSAEELETSKEELQSVNEELITVNHELKDKVEELSHANSDLNNLMTSTDLATMFLDRQLRVVRFTPRMQDIFNLLPADMGRPISDITHKLHYDTLIADAEKVLDRLASIEREIETEDARAFLFRIAPYRTLDDKISGVVVTLIDVTQIKRAEAEVRAGRERYRTLFDLVPVAVYSTDAEGVIQQFNRRAVELWGRRPAENGEKYCGSFKIFYPDGTPMPHDKCPMARVLRGEKLEPSELEILVEQENGDRRNVIVSPSTLTNDRGEITGAINCLHDITQRKLAEQSLGEAAKQREALYEFVHRRHEAKSIWDIYAAGLDAIKAVVNCDRAAIFLFDENGVMQFIDSRGLSDKYREAAGHSPWKAGIKEPLPVFIDDVDRSDFSKSLRSRLKTEGIGAVAFLPLMAEEKLIGAFATFYNSAHVFDEQERSLSLTIGGQLALGIERKRAEEALRQTEERFELLVEGAKDYAMFLLDPDNCITFWSSGAERVFGWSREEAEGLTGAIIFTPQDKAEGAVEQEIGTALREGRAPDRRWHLRKDGSRFWADGVMMRLDHDEGGVRGLVKIARDATDERAAEEALRHAKDQMEQRVVERTRDLVATNNELERTMAQRRQLEKELLEISEREKRRIGQDLHDIVCQELSAAALFLKSSANRTEKRNPATAKTLNEAAEIVNRNVTLARNLARGFQPVKLSGGEFTAAMRALVTQANTNRAVHCRLEMPQPIQILDEAIALNIYRIAQEALTNAIKHGNAKTVVVTLKRSRGHLQLTVEDDGKGFQRKKRSKGLGLHIMDYRASVLGGSFALDTKPTGTRISCTIPLKSLPKKK